MVDWNSSAIFGKEKNAQKGLIIMITIEMDGSEVKQKVTTVMTN